MTDSSGDNYNNERERLISLGIPESAVIYALSYGPSKFYYFVLSALVIIVMVAGFGIGFYFWGHFETLLDENVKAAAQLHNALLYNHNFGISFLIGLFAWIFMSGAIAYATHNLSDKIRASIFVYHYLDQRNAPYIGVFKSKKLSEETDPETYVKSTLNRWTGITLWPAIFLLLASGVVLDKELKSFELFTATGYIAQPSFPWERSKTDSWKNAKYVEVGCNHVTGKNSGEDIIYDVTFENGLSHRLSDAQPTSDDWLSQIEKIDQTLVTGNIEFKRWNWLKRNPLHPDCLASYRKQWPLEDYERLEALLRVDKL